MTLKTFCILLLLGQIIVAQNSFEDELRAKLLENYNKNSFPSPVVKLDFQLSIQGFEINEKKRSLDMRIWPRMTWNDPRLTWDDRSYPNIEKLSFPPSQIWLPDMTLYNSADNEIDMVTVKTKAIVEPNGKTIWIPAGKMSAHCPTDMTYWPYDVHNCTAKFGSWVEPFKRLQLEIPEDSIHFEFLDDDGHKENRDTKWQVESYSMKAVAKIYDCCPEEYVNANANFIIKRISHSYCWTVQMPIVVLGMLTFLVYLIPSTFGVKAIFAVLTLLLSFCTQSKLSNEIQYSSDNVPMIVSLVGLITLYSAINIITCCILLKLAQVPSSRRLPNSVRKLLNKLAKLLFSGSDESTSGASELKRKDLETGGSNSDLKRGSSHSTLPDVLKESDWSLLTAVLDRILFVLFFIIFVVTMITHASVL